MILKSDVKFKEKPVCCFKNDKNLVNFDPSTQKSQKFALWLSFLCKVYNVWPKKVQRSCLLFHWWFMENVKKNWLVVWKVAWEIWQILSRELKSLKIGTFMGSFYLKWKVYEIKIYRGVMCYDNVEWCKIWKGIDLSVKIDMKNLTSFDPKKSQIILTQKSQKFAL